MFSRIVLKSLWERKERFLIAVIAITFGAAMVTSLLTISFDIEERMGLELRSYGANLVVLPGEGKHIDPSGVAHPSIVGSVPYLYFKTEINGKKIDVAGTDPEAVRKMNAWWHVDGSMPTHNEVLAGINAARKLGIKTGDELQIKQNSLKVSGVLETGTSDDDRIFVPLKEAMDISGQNGATSVHLSVLGDIDAVVEYLESENFRVKKIRQVAESEKNLLMKTRLLMSLVAIFVLSAACLSLMSTMITTILERSREIGLMKALGCSNRRVAAIFLTETALMGAVGGIFGYLVGLALARFISMEIFNMPVSVKPEVFVLTLIISVLVALIGSMLPVSRAVSLDPVKILRGE